MTVCAFSQAGYPKLIVTPEGDTAILISPSQMDALNDYRVLCVGKDAALLIKDSLITDYVIQIQRKDSIIYLTDSVVSLTATQLGIQTDGITSAEALLKKMDTLLQKASRRIKWLRIQRGGLGVIVIVEAALLIFTDI